MTIRIPWDRYEVALLFCAYERVASGADINEEARKLSGTLRVLASKRGFSIDDTFRNIAGMKMQLANVQYVFTDGKKGLSGASTMIRLMYEIYRNDPAEYQIILKEATRMAGNTAMSAEDAFFAYAKERIHLSPRMLAEYLQKAADYCHLKQPLLGMTDIKFVRNVQQKIEESKLLRFRFGKEAQAIRNVTQLYYHFVITYHNTKAEQSKHLPSVSSSLQTRATSTFQSSQKVAVKNDKLQTNANDNNAEKDSRLETKKEFESLLDDFKIWIQKVHGFSLAHSERFCRYIYFTYRTLITDPERQSKYKKTEDIQSAANLGISSYERARSLRDSQECKKAFSLFEEYMHENSSKSSKSSDEL